MNPFSSRRRICDRNLVDVSYGVGSKVEAAYRRGDLFEKRLAMMNDWAEFCAKKAMPLVRHE